MWFIGIEVEQETSAPPPKKNSGSAPATIRMSTSFSPNHNPNWSFSFKGNCLSLLFNNKRLVTNTSDLCSVPSKQLKLGFFGSGAATRLGAGQIEIFSDVETFWLYHSQTSLMASLLAFCGGSTAMKLPYTCVNFLKKSNLA